MEVGEGDFGWERYGGDSGRCFKLCLFSLGDVLFSRASRKSGS